MRPRSSCSTWMAAAYSYERDMMSYQKIDYPPWDMYFCHEYQYDFPLMDYLNDAFGLQPELDCVLFMKNSPSRPGARRGSTQPETTWTGTTKPAVYGMIRTQPRRLYHDMIRISGNAWAPKIRRSRGRMFECGMRGQQRAGIRWQRLPFLGNGDRTGTPMAVLRVARLASTRSQEYENGPACRGNDPAPSDGAAQAIDPAWFGVPGRQPQERPQQ